MRRALCRPEVLGWTQCLQVVVGSPSHTVVVVVVPAAAANYYTEKISDVQITDAGVLLNLSGQAETEVAETAGMGFLHCRHMFAATWWEFNFLKIFEGRKKIV